MIGFLRNHGQELIYIPDQCCKSVNFLFSEIFINQFSGEADHTREIEHLNLAQLRTQLTGQPTPGNDEIGNHHNLRYPNLSQPQTQFPGQRTPQTRVTANHYDPMYPDVYYPQNQFSGLPGHPAFQIGEMGNPPELRYRNVSQ